jgi:P-aminobenzoate N-oxygenase AurF
MSTTTPAPRSVDQRIERLSTASLKRIMEPDTEVPGAIGEGQVLPDELLTLVNVPDLFDQLTDEQKRVLAREEFASIVDTGVRFESVLMAGFSMDILSRPDLTDPRVTYLLHEMGEETRHSRLFVRLLQQVKPQAKNPLDNALGRIAMQAVMPLLTGMQSLFCLLVLSGEEVPDLLQKLASEHPETDPMIKAVSKYHRQEEARHLAFGRMLFPEQWEAAGPIERFLVRYLGSRIAVAMFNTIVHPGVYGAIGLPTWRTWKAVNRSAGRTGMRHRALRPLLTPLLEAGVFRGGRVPRGWQIGCGVDRAGRALDPAAAA